MDNIKPTPKTQQEIANELVTPYNNPPGFVGTNPNDALISNSDRSNQISFRDDNTKPFTIGIMDIDESIMYYFANVIKPSIIQNGARIEIPVVYANPERWVASQKEGFLRDKNGKVMCPLITFKRDSLEKNGSYNKLDANYPYNYTTFTKKYSPKNSYDNFNVLNNRVPEKIHYAVVVPDYVVVTYSCTIFTYYVEQMNKVIEAINYASNSYWGDPQRFKFKADIDSFNTVVELNPNEERIVKSTFNIKMNGYLIPDMYNKEMHSVKQFLDKTQVIIEEKIVNNIK